jgi:hypothetical protein
MGACLSGGAPSGLIEKTNGDEEAYRKRFQGASCSFFVLFFVPSPLSSVGC